MNIFWKKEAQTTQEQGLEQDVAAKKPKRLGCFGKTLIGIGIYFLFSALMGLLFGDMFSTPATVLEDNTIYRIDMSGVVVEQAAEANPFEALMGDMM